MTDADFAQRFRASPIQRAKHTGFLRNVAIAMGNSGREEFREPLEVLAQSSNEMVAAHARWALGQLKPSDGCRRVTLDVIAP
jgi:epoxyqueuosine reductase